VLERRPNPVKTALALDITVSQTLLARADKVAKAEMSGFGVALHSHARRKSRMHAPSTNCPSCHLPGRIHAAPSGKSIAQIRRDCRFVKTSREKYFSSVFRKMMRMIRSSRLDEEGRTRRHDREAGCDGCHGAARRVAIVACGKGVWS
jgi:hypothetical protein